MSLFGSRVGRRFRLLIGKKRRQLVCRQSTAVSVLLFCILDHSSFQQFTFQAVAITVSCSRCSIGLCCPVDPGQFDPYHQWVDMWGPSFWSRVLHPIESDESCLGTRSAGSHTQGRDTCAAAAAPSLPRPPNLLPIRQQGLKQVPNV